MPKFTYSKQSHTQKNCDEAEGVNGLHPKDQSQAGIRSQKKAVSPSRRRIMTLSIVTMTVMIVMIMIFWKNLMQPVQISMAMNAYGFCIGKGPILETKGCDEEAKQAPASQTQITLPLKFRFEDEVPKQVEKTEYEKEIEGLFAELDFCWALEELGSYNYPEVDQENGSPAEETHYARCTKGKHELVLRDDQGLICIYCHHVELGPKDVLPQWAEKIYHESERRRLNETGQLLEFNEIHLQSSIDNFAESINVANGTVWSIKPDIRTGMYEHQKEGFEFLWKNLAGSINLDELKSANPDCRPVIIAPASILLTWEEEFRKWNVDFPFLNLNNMDILGKENKTAFELLSGVKRRNMKTIRMVNLYSWNTGRSILGISYSLFEKLTGEKYLKETRNKKKREVIDNGTKDLRKILLEKPGLVVLDEGHTPQVDDQAVEKLKIAMSPFVHVHKGTILQQSLPGLRDCVVLLKPPALQKSLIERLEGTQSTFQFEHKVALISVHPYLLQHSDSTEEERIEIDLGVVKASKLNPNEGAKTKFILEFVRLIMATNEKVLIFSQYIQPLELIKEQLREIFNWVDGKQILQMQGKLDQKQRQILINVFNDPQSESKVMLASTRCCSEGISLVGASRVILLDVVWNPSVERQAISRAYRIGQKKFVYTYHLMTSGTTEADKYCRQAEKERLSELVFSSSSNESNIQKRPSFGIEDMILEEMVGHAKLKEMFEKIINQPKDTNLIQTFGLTS
ncbi:hypothetical protein DH2020_046927 [Rehmannia glutinosa]|uniref:Helicase C-terminal domain-containing protein n=1 Tax=Rehmannia glutinosa TaxID=99300 RepID=A0ABR0UAQ9_REHGL